MSGSLFVVALSGVNGTYIPNAEFTKKFFGDGSGSKKCQLANFGGAVSGVKYFLIIGTLYYGIKINCRF